MPSVIALYRRYPGTTPICETYNNSRKTCARVEHCKCRCHRKKCSDTMFDQTFLTGRLSLLSVLCLLPLCYSAKNQTGYSTHDPHLKASLHDEQFFTFLSVRLSRLHEALGDTDILQRPDITFAPRWDIEVYDKASVAPGYWLISPYAR